MTTPHATDGPNATNDPSATSGPRATNATPSPAPAGRPSAAHPPTPDPKLDLVLQRVIDVPPAVVWAAWTRPEHLSRWFTPAPWTVSACEIDVRPGGSFRTVMRSPDGQDHPNDGCYLEVVPHERLVFTSALLPGYRPAPDAPMPITAYLTLEPVGSGTRYTATVCTGTRPAAASTRRWASTPAGARPSTSSSNTRRR
jgi:uncharacterized protein YndB with AHSA1/START domain